MRALSWKNHPRHHSDSELRTVILASRWSWRLTGVAPEIGGSYRSYLVELGKTGPLTDAETRRVFRQSLWGAIKAFTKAGKQVIVSGVTGNQAFSFIGASAFTNQAGQLRVDTSDPNKTMVLGDVNGDGVADFAIELAGTHVLDATDFLL